MSCTVFLLDHLSHRNRAGINQRLAAGDLDELSDRAELQLHVLGDGSGHIQLEILHDGCLESFALDFNPVYVRKQPRDQISSRSVRLCRTLRPGRLASNRHFGASYRGTRRISDCALDGTRRLRKQDGTKHEQNRRDSWGVCEEGKTLLSNVHLILLQTFLFEYDEPQIGFNYVVRRFWGLSAACLPILALSLLRETLNQSCFEGIANPSQLPLS
jgi:hypothetical protein